MKYLDTKKPYFSVRGPIYSSFRWAVGTHGHNGHFQSHSSVYVVPFLLLTKLVF